MSIFTKIFNNLKGQAKPVLTQSLDKIAQAGNPIGDAAIKVVTALESTTKDGATKKAEAIAAVLPVILSEATKGGIKPVVADAEAFAGVVVEAVVGTLKQTSIVTLALALLKAII